MKEFCKENYKGVTLCLTIALICYFGVEFYSTLEVIGAPVFGIIIGMVLGLIIKDKSALQSGIQFTSKKVLQYAVILLGFGLNIGSVTKVGAISLPIILSTITTSLVLAFAMYKALRLPSKTAVLIGVGSSICGGSAIAATAPVVDADDEEVAQSISVIFLFNVIAALLFPTLGGILGLSNDGFGLFAGTAVNDTSSVTAAASTWDTLYSTGGTVLQYATIVKLTRTLAIIPITLALSFYRLHKEKGNKAEKVKISKIFPMFILYFVLASILTSIANVCLDGVALETVTNLFAFLKQLSKFFIVMAMTAIGMNTDLVKLVKSGGKPILLGATCWIGITIVSLSMQRLLGIW